METLANIGFYEPLEDNRYMLFSEIVWIHCIFLTIIYYIISPVKQVFEEEFIK